MRGCIRGVVLAVAMICGASIAAPARAQPLPSRAQEEFVPLKELPREEQMPAAPLLIGAYSFVWVVLFGYVWSMRRRMARVERELAVLEHRRAERG